MRKKTLKKLEAHLDSLSASELKTLEAKSCLVRWPGLTSVEAKERHSLITAKYLGNPSDEQASRLLELNGRISGVAKQGV